MDKLVEEFVKERISIYEFSKKYNVEQSLLIDKLKQDGFLYARPKIKASNIIDLKFASDEYLQDDTIQAQEICVKYNVSHSTFSRYMKEYVHVPIKARPKANFNERYFDNIDTETKAYLLGFYWADGYISSSPIDETKVKNAYTIELSIAEKDIEIVELVKKEFQTPRPILYQTCKNPSGSISNKARIIVNSKHMWNTLNNYGCTPRKSLTEKFPNVEIFRDKSLVQHFIRGYFDGDGCISYADKEHKRPNFQMLGTLEFLTEVLTFFPKECQNLTIRHNHNNPKEIIRFINTSDDKAIKIFNYLYKNATIYLNRKYKRYLALCCSNTTFEQTKNGEGCDANTVVIVETKESTIP